MYTGDHYLEIQFEKESGKQLLLSLPEMLSKKKAQILCLPLVSILAVP